VSDLAAFVRTNTDNDLAVLAMQLRL
jgi:hypothetical protein